MKKFAALLSLTTLAVCLPSVLADTGGRVVEIDGDVMLGSGAAAVGADIGDGNVLVAAEGAHARVSIPGVGDVRLAGPASVRVDHADGVPVLTALSGNVSFAYQGDAVRLAVEGGKLDVSGVNGRSATLSRGTEISIEAGKNGPTVSVRSGSALFSGEFEHALLRSRESREFGSGRRGGRSIVLSGHELELQMPTEVLLEDRPLDSPALRELESAWNRGRESPRIP